MKAIVRKVNYKKEMLVFETEHFDCGWLEVLGGIEIDEDYELEGNFNNLGNETITILSTGEQVEVFIEDFGMAYKNAVNQIFR